VRPSSGRRPARCGAGDRCRRDNGARGRRCCNNCVRLSALGAIPKDNRPHPRQGQRLRASFLGHPRTGCAPHRSQMTSVQICSQICPVRRTLAVALSPASSWSNEQPIDRPLDETGAEVEAARGFGHREPTSGGEAPQRGGFPEREHLECLTPMPRGGFQCRDPRRLPRRRWTAQRRRLLARYPPRPSTPQPPPGRPVGPDRERQLVGGPGAAPP
jgi:hypothetical protein